MKQKLLITSRLALLLASFMSIAFGIYAADPVKVGDLYYELDAASLTAKIVASPYGERYSLTPHEYDPTITSYNLPAQITTTDGTTYTVTTIGANAFNEGYFVGRLIIPNTVTVIEESAFEQAQCMDYIIWYEHGMQSFKAGLELPSSLISIGESAFYGFSSDSQSGVNPEEAKTMVIPGSIEVIPESAFENLSGFTKVIIEEGVQEVSNRAFYSCSYHDGETWQENVQFSLPSSLKKIGNEAFMFGGDLLDGLPDGIEEIGRDAFWYSKIQGELTLPSSLTTLGGGAFSEIKISAVSIPSSLKQVGYVFAGCENLTKVILAEGIEELDGTFSGSPIAEVTLPSSLKKIGGGTFNAATFENITLPNNLEELGENSMPSTLKSINIPGSVTEITRFINDDDPNSDESKEVALSQITLNEGIQTIKYGALSNCSKLESITIPASVSTIERSSLPGTCKDVTFLSTSVPENISQYTFSFGSETEYVNVYVLESAVEDYKTAFDTESNTQIHVYAIGDEPSDVWVVRTPTYQIEDFDELQAVGCKLQLNATLMPAGTSTGLYWWSSDDMIATVDENGLVSQISPGTVTVFVRPASIENYQNPPSVTLYVRPVITDFTIEYKDGQMPYIIPGTTRTLRAQYDDVISGTIYSNPCFSWKSSDSEIASVQFGGKYNTYSDDCNVIAHKTGTVTITATEIQTGIVREYTYVVASSVTNIEINTPQNNIAVGNTVKIDATVTPADATNKFTWTVYPTNLASIDDDGNLTCKAAGDITVTATAIDGTGITGTANLTIIEPVNASEIFISKANNASTTIVVGKTLDLYYNTIPENATGIVTWQSSDEEVATIEVKGTKATITGIAKGDATITAVIANAGGTSAEATIEVTVIPPVEKIEFTLDEEVIQNNQLSVLTGSPKTITPRVIPEDATSALTWSSSDETIATVTPNEDGTVTITGLTPADVYIRARSTDGTDVSSSLKVTVVIGATGIEIDNVESTEMITGSNLQLSARVLPAEASQEIVWESDNTEVATVDINGKVTAVAKGSVNITATATNMGETQYTDKIELTINPAVEVINITGSGVDNNKLYLAIGNSTTLNVEVLPTDANQLLTWENSNSDALKTTFNADGTVTIEATAPGEAILTASSTDGSNVSQSITINMITAATGVEISTPSNTVGIGSSIKLSASVLPATASQKVTWTSADDAIATIDEQGNLTGVAEGIVKIKASATNLDGSTLETEIEISVLPAVESVTIDNETSVDVTIFEGASASYKVEILPATALQTLRWNISNEEVVSLSKDDVGNITIKGEKAGKATIEATSEDGSNISAAINVEVIIPVTGITIDTPEKATIVEGKALQLSARVTPIDAPQKVNWSSSDEEVATVDENGLVTGIKAGNVTITISTKNTLNGEEKISTIELTVESPVAATRIEITNPESTDIYGEETLQLTYTTDPVNANGTIKWTSSNEALATIDQNGLVTALVADGEVEIIVSITNANGEEILSTPLKLNVIASRAVLASSLSVNPTSISDYVSSQYTLVAKILPEDVTSKELTWSVENSSICSVKSDGLTATIKLLKVGTTTITVSTNDGSNQSATVKVTCIRRPTVGIEQVNADAQNGEAVIYDLSGRRIYRVSKAGIYIINNVTTLVK